MDKINTTNMKKIKYQPTPGTPAREGIGFDAPYLTGMRWLEIIRPKRAVAMREMLSDYGYNLKRCRLVVLIEEDQLYRDFGKMKSRQTVQCYIHGKNPDGERIAFIYKESPTPGFGHKFAAIGKGPLERVDSTGAYQAIQRLYFRRDQKAKKGTTAKSSG